MSPDLGKPDTRTTPWNVSPLPIGQFTAYVGRENSRSIWSNNSSGSRDGRSILWWKRKAVNVLCIAMY